MKNIKKLLSVSVIWIGLLFSACSQAFRPGTTSFPAFSPDAAAPQQETPTPADTLDLPQSSFAPSDPSSSTISFAAISFSLEDVAPYSGQPYVTVNDNVPYFSEDELTPQSFTAYSDLDELGRCGTAYASISTDIMPANERGPIGYIKPSGWHTVKYNGLIDGNYLYNRCHLIGYQLCGENDEKNLFTGTRYLNVQGMQPFENMIADYVSETEDHVLYRVTPIFEGDNLVASGVLMEARSVEDKGGKIQFCVYVYNEQPGIVIDHATGESCLAPDMEAGGSAAAMPTEAPPASRETEPQGTTYILNTNTMKFHFPSCQSVDQMKAKNRQEYTGTRDELISQGYVPCKNCDP